MKNKSISVVLCLTIMMISCISTANVVPTETSTPTLVFTSTTIPSATSASTYVYLPTITLVPSSTPFAITPGVSQALTSQNSQANYGNAFTVTVEEESFFVKDYRDPVYRVLLNYKNSSEEEITDLTFYLVTYKSKDYKVFPNIYNFADFWVNVLGSNQERNAIPVGESHIVIDVSIYADGYYSQCKDGSLDKPLYLLLFFGPLGNTDNPLEVSNDLNQRILEIPCKYL